MKEMKTLTINGVTYTVTDPDAASIDNSKVGADAWSSKNIVDKLCPAFTESGVIVTCEPVEGYPLTVIADAAATAVTRCGKNLFDFTQELYEVTIVSSTGTELTHWGVAVRLPAGTYTLHAEEKEPSTIDYFVYGVVITAGGVRKEACSLRGGQTNYTRTVTIDNGDVIYIYQGGTGMSYNQAMGTFACFNIQAEVGNTATAFEPYIGGTFAPGETIPALPGINTIWADTGVVAVTGRTHRIETADSLDTSVVKYTAQSLPTTAQAQARANIGAQPVGKYLTEVPEGYAKNEDIEKVDRKVDALRAVVSKFHSNIVETASGETIVLDDASDMELAGLRIFGKTVQNGTPTPEAPVPLESAGASGAINTTVCGGNLIPFPYKETSKTRNGVTWTVNPDGSVTANGTATGETYFILCDHIEFAETSIFNLGHNPVAHEGKTFTDCSYNHRIKTLSINIAPAGVTVSNEVFYPMINYGKTALPYEPYKGQTLTVSTPNGLPGIPVSSGGNYTDESGQQWVCDEVDSARGKYVQKIKTLMTDITWDSNAITERYTALVFNVPDVVETTNIDTNLRCLCNMVQTVPAYYRESVIPNISIISNRRIMLIVDNNAFGFTEDTSSSTRNNIINNWWKSQDDIQIMYEMASPIEHDLTAEELAQYAALHTNYPNTTIFNDAGADMEVKYVADTKLYIDKKFAELSAALLNQ